MRFVYFVVLASLFCVVLGAYMPSTPQARIDPARVILIYDSSCTVDEDQNGVQDSLQLAQFYSSVRGVPIDNLYGMDGSQVNVDTGNFSGFTEVTLKPFNEFLASFGYFNVDVLLTFWPLPLRAPLGYNTYQNNWYEPIGFDEQLSVIRSIFITKVIDYLSLGPSNPYYDPSTAYWPQAPRYNHNIENSFPDYFSTNKVKFGINSTADYYLRARIDGPGGLAQKMNMISNAMYADKYVNTDAFWGTTYVDTYGGNPDYEYIKTFSSVYGGNYYNVTDGNCADGTLCDAAIALGGKFIKDLGLPFKWELSGKMIGDEGAVWNDDGQPALSAPNTMLSFGWYAYQSPRVVFDFLPGAYYADHDSASLGANRIRDPSFGTTGGQALYRGASVTVGALTEPGMSGHCRVYTPPIYLLRGYSWAEASNLACGVGYSQIIGDPLYQPFADKELVVDIDAPQLEDTPTVFFANKSGGVIVFNLKGVESAKLTLRYGVVSVFEHTVESMYYMKYFRQPFYTLRGSTTYKYRLDLVDPAGNTFVSDVYTFTTPPQTPFIGTPEPIPGEILISHFDYGGSGITYRDLTGIPYASNGNRPECDLQVAYYDDNFVFKTYDDEYLKYTIHADKSGVYSFELMYATDGYNNNDMEVLTYLDGHLITDRHAVLPSGASMGNYQMVGSMTVGAGDHVLMLRFNYTGNPNLIIADWSNAGQFYRMRFALVNELTDGSAPTAVVVSSDDTGDYYVENVQFGDDIGIAYVKVEINNGAEVINIYELPDGLLFPFHFSAYDVSSVTITAYDAAGQSSTPITKSYDIRTRPIAPIAPPSSISSPGSNAPGVIRTPDGKQVIALAVRNHFNIAAVLFVLLLVIIL